MSYPCVPLAVLSDTQCFREYLKEFDDLDTINCCKFADMPVGL